MGGEIWPNLAIYDDHALGAGPCDVSLYGDALGHVNNFKIKKKTIPEDYSTRGRFKGYILFCFKLQKVRNEHFFQCKASCISIVFWGVGLWFVSGLYSAVYCSSIRLCTQDCTDSVDSNNVFFSCAFPCISCKSLFRFCVSVELQIGYIYGIILGLYLW